MQILQDYHKKHQKSVSLFTGLSINKGRIALMGKGEGVAFTDANIRKGLGEFGFIRFMYGSAYCHVPVSGHLQAYHSLFIGISSLRYH